MYFDVDNNKRVFIELLDGINREGFRKEELIKLLEESDFFEAPASTKYHNSVKGGLVDHSLCVYFNMKSLSERKQLNIDNESLLIVGLFHDIYKRNFYTSVVQNKKVYKIDGTKKDELGCFDWESSMSYSVDENHFLFGPNGATSEYIISKYIPLKLEESVAIINMSVKDEELNLALLDKYPLLTIAKVSDLLSCYIDERVTDEQVY